MKMSSTGDNLEFRLEKLGVDAKLGPNVRMFYRRELGPVCGLVFSILERERVGKCRLYKEEGLWKISITNPSISFLKLYTGFEGMELDMAYLSCCGHEEAHALQMSGNSAALYGLIKELTGKELRTDKARSNDDMIKSYMAGERKKDDVEKYYPLSERDREAQAGAVLALVRKGYAADDIRTFIRRRWEFKKTVCDNYSILG